MAAVNRWADIFCGLNPDFEPIVDWNDRLHVGLGIRSRLGGQPNQDLAY
jgi:hypothetical protein